MRDYQKDVKICIKRLYIAERRLKEYLKGERNDPCVPLDEKWIEHPFLDYSSEEKLAFVQIFGPPLRIPEEPTDFLLDLIIEKRNLYREIAGMTNHPRFLDDHNYLEKWN